MNRIRKALGLLPAAFIYLMFCVIFWGFVFTRITDTDAAHKLTLYADAQVTDGVGLAVKIEETAGEGIRLAQARAFDYAMFDGDQLRNADLFIIRADHLSDYRDWVAPLPEALRSRGALWEEDGQALGLKIYSVQTHSGPAMRYVNYLSPHEPETDCYLCFGASSLHLADGEALKAAETVLSLP